MVEVKTVNVGDAKGIIIGDTVHVLKWSSSRYHLRHEEGGVKHQYVCQDGCCDRGLRPDVSEVIRQAKAQGATKVILRTGQREYYHPEIHGLKVLDVSNHTGKIADGWQIVAW